MKKLLLLFSFCLVQLSLVKAQDTMVKKHRISGIIISGIFDMDVFNSFNAFNRFNFQPGIGVFWVNARGDNHLLSGSFSGGFGGRLNYYDSLGAVAGTVSAFVGRFNPEYQYRFFLKPIEGKDYRLFLGAGVKLEVSLARSTGVPVTGGVAFPLTSVSSGFSLVFEPGIRIPLDDRLFLDVSAPVTLSRSSLIFDSFGDPAATANTNYAFGMFPFAGIRLGLGINR